MSVSVLIPYRYKDEWRDTLFAFVYARFYSMWPQFEICLGDPDRGEFSRSAAINDAARKAHGDFFLICDADTFTNVTPLADLLSHVSAGAWGFPYGVYYNLTPHDTTQVVNGPHNAELDRPTNWEHALDYVVSGMVMVPRSAFEDIGGFDEEYIGWGYEDDDFSWRMTKKLGKPYRVDNGFVCHLWHPAPENERFGQPFIVHNRNRYENLVRRG